MQGFITLVEGRDKRIIGVIDYDRGIMKKYNLKDYNVTLNLDDSLLEEGTQLKEILLEKNGGL